MSTTAPGDGSDDNDKDNDNGSSSGGGGGGGGGSGGRGSQHSSESENDDTLPDVPRTTPPIMRRLARRSSSLSGPWRYKPLLRSASLTVADFTSEWNEVFRMFDTNLNGIVTCDELGGKMRSLGYNVTQSEVQDLVHEWDKDDKGALSLTEFTLMMNSSRFRPSSSASSTAAGSSSPNRLSDGTCDTRELLELKSAFDLFDRDKNGLLDTEEVKIALQLMGEILTDAEVDYIVAEADTDKDGAISFREFCDIVLGRSLSPRSPFYFHGRSVSQRRQEEEERRVRLEYQIDHVTSRPG